MIFDTVLADAEEPDDFRVKADAVVSDGEENAVILKTSGDQDGLGLAALDGGVFAPGLGRLSGFVFEGGGEMGGGGESELKTDADDRVCGLREKALGGFDAHRRTEESGRLTCRLFERTDEMAFTHPRLTGEV